MRHLRSYAPSGIEAALEHCRAGRLQQAEALCRKMPNNPEALHLRGIIAHQLNRNDEAVELINRAITLKPDNASYYYSIEHAYRALNRMDDVIAAYQRLLSHSPENALAYNNFGNALKDCGRVQDAESCYRKAIALEPNFAEAHANLGVLYTGSDNLEQAIACLQKAIELKPRFAGAHNDLGIAWSKAGQIDRAAASFRAAADIDPDFAGAWHHLASALRDQGKLNDAVDCFRKLLARRPELVEAHNDLGVTYAYLGKLNEAIASYRAALALKPDFVAACNNLGAALLSKGMPDEAIACYRKAIEHRRDYADAYDNLLLAMQYSAAYRPEQMVAAHKEYAAQFEAPLKPYWRPHDNLRDPGKRLKIGYVSADFNNHAVAYFIEPVLALHDKSRFEIYCYYNSTRQQMFTQRLQALADHWIPCKHLSDDQLAAQIRADGIDILVDLSGHTGHNRLLTFARKPAPVQVTYLGYPATTGLSAIDYRITDFHAEPPGMTEQFNVEQLWRLPEIFCCYRADNGPDVIDHPPFEDNGYITFGCFNNFAKVNDAVIALWAKILEKVPGARLMLEINGVEDPDQRAQIEQRFALAGVAGNQLILIPRKRENQYVLYNRIDIALDPFPCNGGTTSLDTLWMGVPFVTLAGRHFTSRMGVTILTNAALGELIAHNENEYVEIAAALAQDRVRLKQIRHGLRERVQASPLMDAPRFTGHLEQAYRDMWKNWCEQDTGSQPVQSQADAPAGAALLNNQGVALADQGRFDEAIACYLQALALKPGFAEVHSNLGLAFAAKGNRNEAITCYQTALMLKPGFAEANNNLGIELKEQGKLDEAIHCFEKALAAMPDFAEAHCNLGITFHRQGKPDAAIASYRKALDLKPDYLDAHDSLLLTMLYSERHTPEEVFAEQQRFAQQFESPFKPDWRPHQNSRDPHKRLKIAYVSPDLRRHPVATFIEPVLARHDKSQFEVFCYYNNREHDTVSQHLQALADHWIACRDMADEALAERIRADGIDILVDLAGHTGYNRLLVFARKPAPVQVTYLGYPSSTGLTSIDYRVTDAHAEPPGMTEQLNSEQLWRLPEAFFCYGKPQNGPAVIDHPPYEDNGYVTFGSFNNFGKVGDQVIALWSRILLKVPDARLMLVIHGVGQDQLRAEVELRFARHGVSPARLKLVPPLQENHFVLYNAVDIALDPFPFSGHTTSLDTLWMGVPFVTLAGRHYLSRMGVSTLVNAGLPELIAASQDDYVDIAAGLALDRARLKALRTGLRERLEAGPLMNAPRFTRELEQAYRGMWQNWCASAAENTPPVSGDAVTLNDAGNTLRDQGRLDDAVICYRQAAAANPDLPEIHYNLATALQDQQHLDDAICSYERALALKPDLAPAHHGIALALADQGKLDAAIGHYQKAIALDPRFAVAYNNLGNAYRAQGKMQDAMRCYECAIAIDPGFAEAYNSLGVAFHVQGRIEDAIACYRKAIDGDANCQSAHNNLGTAFHAQGLLDEAIASYRQATALGPLDSTAHCNLGNAYADRGRLNEAASSYLQAIALKPDYAEAYNNLGIIFANNGQLDEAITCYETAIAVNPDYAEGHNNLGNAFAERNRIDEARQRFQTALALRPDFAEAHFNLGRTYHQQGLPDEAINCFRKALTYRPDYPDAYDSMLLAMQYSAVYPPEEMVTAHKEYGAQFETPLKPHWRPHDNPRNPDKRLKIGYVSADFNNHSVSFFFEPILALHDKSQVEIYCYYNGTRHDAVTERIMALADHWVPCKTLSDDQLAAQIRADGVDILVDLAGHSGGNRLLTFARKPAPVQASYLGYPATTGLTAIDYRITDIHVEPPGMTEQFNVEQLWRLPEIFCCYRPHDNSPDVIDHPPFKDNGYITFGCFNNFAKVTDPVISLWARILDKVPTARLMLEIHGIADPAQRSAVEQRFARLGIAPKRLILEPRKPENQYVLYNRIDIALDPFPCNGGTTSLDTLWMGVPFVTLAGRHFTSRMGVTILTNAGLPELIATSEEDYVDIAVALALDGDRLKALRSGLRERARRSPLMDAPRFTRHLEQAYRGMWRHWCGDDRNTLDEAATLNNAANVFKDQGRLDEAIARYRQALTLKPDFAVAQYNLGTVFHIQGKLNEAVSCYRKTLALDPGFTQAWNNLGIILAEQGNPGDAADCYRRALAVASEFAEAHANLGTALRELGRFDEAITASLKAISLKPNFPEAFNNLGMAFADQGNPDAAIECYRTALELRPDFASAYNNLGLEFKAQGKTDDAVACFRQALAVAPEDVKALVNLGTALLPLGKETESIACYRKAVALKPDFAEAYDSLLLALQYSSAHTPEELFAEHLRFAAQFEAPLKAYWSEHGNPRDTNRRLKIGYVSPDFNSHPVAYFIEPVLALHDKSRFEIHCYDNYSRPDGVTRRLQTLVDRWIPCWHLSDEQLADQIRADGIDILVDLAGHTGHNRLLTFARKPAPVQVTYLGYPATTGLSAIDYRITDIHAEPPGMTEQFNVEQLWRLPEIFCCYRADNGPEVIDHPPFEDNGHLTFGCFNNFAKVNDAVIALWAKILERVPDARLMMEIQGIDNPHFRKEVEDRFGAAGIPPGRLILVPRKRENQYVLYNRIDIALDPFPCNGGTTSLDTLWMGVPFVTLAGNHFTARMGVTILTNAGLGELIAHNENEYVEIAAALAQDRARLKQLRHGLRERVQASPLMDAPRFTRHLEQAYRDMWNNWCQRAPVSGSEK